MSHRGPNGAGCWVSDDGRVGLGHRRLSIIDLSCAATQPMSNEDGRLRIVFNGEIYNHAEIRMELEALGTHSWVTDHSDTEVILHAFEEWGIDCVSRFRGMFAFGVWDSRNQELWLVRDRIGVKPLYYSIHHGRLVFASEIKALLVDPGQPRRVNQPGIFQYLSFLTVPAPSTLFDGIYKLPPATWMRVHIDGTVTERQYWDVWDHVTPLMDVTEEEIADRVLAELCTAVQLRKVSDVPVGVFLSGGIDSSTNAALFSRGDDQPVKTFAIGYDRDYSSYSNELHYARMMADWVGADHHELILTQRDLLSFLPDMIRLQDEPIGDPVCVPVYYVSRLARDHGVTVCQLGEGADELFWGYRSWGAKLRLQRLADLPVPRSLKGAGVAAMRMMRLDHRIEYDLLHRAALGQPVVQGYDAMPASVKRSILGPELRREAEGLSAWDSVQPYWEHFKLVAWEPGNLHWMSYLDLKLRLPELLLMRVDKMTMAVGLEGRVPFLDHKFVELAMGIPEAVKTKNGTLKYILKKAVRGIIPDAIIDRRKQGFGAPVNSWFSSDLGRLAQREIETFRQETGFLDRRGIEELYRRSEGEKVWFVLNLALWWKEYIADRRG